MKLLLFYISSIIFGFSSCIFIIKHIQYQCCHAGLAQQVEQLNRNQLVTGSIPVAGSIPGHLAQLGEHLFDVQKVGGSIPSVPTIG